MSDQHNVVRVDIGWFFFKRYAIEANLIKCH